MPIGRKLAAIAVATAVVTAGCSSNDDSADRAANAAKAFDVEEIDTSIKPCVDFNAFVNKKWTDAATIPDDKSSHGIFDMLQDRSDSVQREIAESAARDLKSIEDQNSDRWKIGAVYASAMDEKTINALGFDPIKPELGRIDSMQSVADMTQFLDEDGLDGGGILYGVGPGPDFKDASKTIAYSGSGGVNLPSKEYYTDPVHQGVVDGYLAYTQKLLELVGAPDPAGQVQRAFDIERQLAAATFSPEEARKPENQYKVVSVEEADKIAPAIGWRKFLDAQGLPDTTQFSQSETAFFTKLQELLTTVPMDQWKSFLRINVVMRSAGRLSQDFRDARFEYSKLLSGVEAQPERWRVALSTVNQTVGGPLGKLYAEQVFDADAKERAEALVRNVLEALQARIEKLGWMSADTKQKALDKLALIVPRVGYPDKWRDFSGLKIESDNFFGNLRAAEKFNNEYAMNKIDKPTDRTLWSTAPQTANAFYNRSDNTINFPAAILQPPFFDPKADDALNYGAIGAIIGHEATHAFDDQGRKFDGKGNNTDWWTPADAEQFDTRSAKLVQQFDSYVPLPDKPDLHVNGELTLGENIADLGGILTAYDALQKTSPGTDQIAGYTPAQRFFLAFGRNWRDKSREETLITLISTDSHSPAPLRVNGVVPNVPSFAEAFGCQPNEPMVNSGDQLVSVW